MTRHNQLEVSKYLRKPHSHKHSPPTAMYWSPPLRRSEALKNLDVQTPTPHLIWKNSLIKLVFLSLKESLSKNEGKSVSHCCVVVIF